MNREMRTFRLEKLVHDDIVEFNLKIGASVDFEVQQGDIKVESLVNKLDEETLELFSAETDSERSKEVEDIRSVLYAIRKALGYKHVDPDYVPTKTFDKGHYVRTVTVPPGEWTEYYASQPERFPEVM